MKIRKVALAAAICLAAASPYASGQGGPAKTAILTDALVFKGSELAGKANVDVYVTVPYQSMEFHEYDDRYAAQYKLSVVVRDKVGRRLEDTTVTRSMLTEDYEVAHGIGGSADNVVIRFQLKPASYRYDILVDDLFSQREFEVTDTVEVPDLTETPTLSSIMYVSEIEQRGSRFAITPYVGSQMWNSQQTLFAFFETYIDELPKRVAFAWEIEKPDGRDLGRGISPPKTIDDRTEQHFVPLRFSERALPGRYILKVTVHPVTENEPDTTVILAKRTRDYVVPRTLEGSVLSDLGLAIRQMAYVADQDQIDYIEGAKDPAERQFRFEEFWKQLDPSPNTVRNEAFEEYYRRISASNKRFKSYADGWLTDMGRVYIIFGEPANTERFQSQTGMTVAVRWIYNNNLAFTFEDNTGFGDFRLRTPLPPGEKFRYRR